MLLSLWYFYCSVWNSLYCKKHSMPNWNSSRALKSYLTVHSLYITHNKKSDYMWSCHKSVARAANWRPYKLGSLNLLLINPNFFPSLFVLPHLHLQHLYLLSTLLNSVELCNHNYTPLSSQQLSIIEILGKKARQMEQSKPISIYWSYRIIL